MSARDELRKYVRLLADWWTSPKTTDERVERLYASVRAEVLREAADALEASALGETLVYAAARLRRMADEAGKVTRKGEITQPADSCGCCRQPFDPTDHRFDGRARHRLSPWCRRCVDRCHESTDAFHVCPVCRTGAEGGDSRG
ncbi:hypothetical protein AB0L49_02520 [Streptomyces antimycoticus]|uniref:hypothetical protein n=1 Tax=Streptomyces antimycoticus TaxID=68175 RepID=UPI0034195152